MRTLIAAVLVFLLSINCQTATEPESQDPPVEFQSLHGIWQDSVVFGQRALIEGFEVDNTSVSYGFKQIFVLDFPEIQVFASDVIIRHSNKQWMMIMGGVRGVWQGHKQVLTLLMGNQETGLVYVREGQVVQPARIKTGWAAARSGLRIPDTGLGSWAAIKLRPVTDTVSVAMAYTPADPVEALTAILAAHGIAVNPGEIKFSCREEVCTARSSQN